MSDAATMDLVEFSRERIEKGSKSFAVAARLFAPDTRASAYMLYAWCRYCDDVIDGQELGHRSPDGMAPSGDAALDAVAELERKTREACAGQATEPVFRALATVCQNYDIPERYPLDLIEGFRMDAAEHAYATIEDTLLYCYHVAGVVGVMMAMLMGARDRAVLNRACDLGIALQLTNIARDIVPDHAVGRVYLPADWLAEAGLTQDTMADPAHRATLYTVADRLLTTAEPYYLSAQQGLSHLPFRSAWAVAAAANVYGAIGDEIRKHGAGAWDQRAGTGKLTKLGGVASGLSQALGSRSGGQTAQHDRSHLWTMPD